MPKAYNAFIEKQNQIFDKFRATTAQLGDQGVEVDHGADPQGAFLVAWRYPESTTGLVEEFSLEASNIIDAITYGKNNAHTTISDYNLQPNLVIQPANLEHGEVLDVLAKAVKRALEASGKQQISGCEVEYTDMPTNGKTIIAAGVPTESIWQINQQILTESSDLGIQLKGSWGSHMTTSRFLESKPAGSRAVHDLMNLLQNTPAIGRAVPTSIDVGYFHIDPQNGFVFTPYEQFGLGPQNY